LIRRGNPAEKYRDVTKLLKAMYGDVNERDFVISHVLNKSLFEFIVATVLSQNTSDKNALKALNYLKKVLEGDLSPEKIARLSYEELIDAVKPAGMQEVRSKIIRELAEFFLDEEKVKNLINEINSGDIEYARLVLKSLPGVGDKTADVVLLMYLGKPTFPVDTHIARITNRLTGEARKSYAEIRRFWMKILEPKDYLITHLLLITHGRKTCKSKRPLCNRCLLKTMCSFYQSTKA